MRAMHGGRKTHHRGPKRDHECGRQKDAAHRAGKIDAVELEVDARRLEHVATLHSVSPTSLPASDVPPRSFSGAPFTLALMWINAIVFVLEVLFARTPAALLEVPLPTAMAFGANYASATLYDGRIETLLTSCFVHFSILHIGFNLYVLRQVGPFVERAVGHGRMASMYVVAGVLGSMASTLKGALSPTPRIGAGASGAICGVIAAALVIGFRTQGWRSPLMRSMGRSLGVVLLFGLLTNVDNAAHVGGAMGGALVASLWRRGEERGIARNVRVTIAALLLVVSFGVVAARDLTDPFATLEASARLDYALAALQRGDCRDARLALDATRRVAPRAVDVQESYRLFDEVCRLR